MRWYTREDLGPQDTRSFASKREVEKLLTELEYLRSLLRLCNIDCGELHHSVEDRHKGYPCPVVERINAAIIKGGE